MKTSGTNSAGRHVVQCVLLWAVQCQGQRNRRTELFVPLPGLATTSLALYRVMQSLPPHSPPSNPLSRSHAQRRVEGMGASFLLEKPK